MKKFLKYIFIGFVLVLGWVCWPREVHLTFIHTNDLHAHLLPSNSSGQDCERGSDCLGGLARLQGFLDAERQKDSDVLYFDAGDRFSGTFFYTLHKENDLIPLFNLLKPDVLTLGNHEFDDKPIILKHFLDQVKAPCVVSNASFQDVDLQKRVVPSLILQRKGIQIGVIGAVPVEIKTSSMHTDGIELNPLIASLKSEIEHLKESGVSIIVLISHLGILQELEVAKALPDIDLIIGGHSHTLLSNHSVKAEGPYPMVIEHTDKTKTLIVSTGAYGQYVGKLDVAFNRLGEVKTFAGDSLPLSDNVSENDKSVMLIFSGLESIQTELNQKIQMNPFPILMTENKNYCAEDCPIGQAVAEMILTQVPEVDMVLINSGGIRSGLEKGEVLLKHLIQILPFTSTLVSTQMTGRELKDYITQGLGKYKTKTRVNALLQIAGGSYTFHPLTRQLVSLKVQKQDVVLDKKYTILLPQFLAKGGDGFSPLHSYKIADKTMREYVQDYLEKRPYIPTEKFNVQKDLISSQ